MQQHTKYTHQGTRKSFHDVKTKEREMTKKEIVQLMLEAEVGRIVTIGKDGPHITPLSFVYYNNSIYIHSRSKGKKLDNIRYHSRVCFEVDKITLRSQNKVRWKSVIIQGIAMQVNDADEIINALSAMKQKSLGIMPTKDNKSGSNNKMSPAMLQQLTVIKIEPNNISSRLNEQM